MQIRFTEIPEPSPRTEIQSKVRLGNFKHDVSHRLHLSQAVTTALPYLGAGDSLQPIVRGRLQSSCGQGRQMTPGTGAGAGYVGAVLFVGGCEAVSSSIDNL
jgi:hypothetical protein